MRLKSPTATPISFGTKLGSGHCMVLGPDGDEVPQILVQAAFAEGAVPADEDPEAFVSAPADAVVKTNQELVQEGIKALLMRNDPTDFTASGLPDLRKLRKVVGLNVTAEELTDAWQALNDSV